MNWLVTMLRPLAAVIRVRLEIRRRKARWTALLNAAYERLEAGRPDTFLWQREREALHRRLEELDAIEAALEEEWE